MASGKGVSLRLLLTAGNRLLKSAVPVGRLSATTARRGGAAMAVSATQLVDDDQGSYSSLFDVIWGLDYPVSRVYGGPAALELPRGCTFGLALLNYQSPGMDGVEPCGRLKPVPPGTVGVRETGFAAAATMQAVAQASGSSIFI
jgi:CheY-like chemotaxis protein